MTPTELLYRVNGERFIVASVLDSKAHAAVTCEFTSYGGQPYEAYRLLQQAIKNKWNFSVDIGHGLPKARVWVPCELIERIGVEEVHNSIVYTSFADFKIYLGSQLSLRPEILIAGFLERQPQPRIRFMGECFIAKHADILPFFEEVAKIDQLDIRLFNRANSTVDWLYLFWGLDEVQCPPGTADVEFFPNPNQHVGMSARVECLLQIGDGTKLQASGQP